MRMLLFLFTFSLLVSSVLNCLVTSDCPCGDIFDYASNPEDIPHTKQVGCVQNITCSINSLTNVFSQMNESEIPKPADFLEGSEAFQFLVLSEEARKELVAPGRPGRAKISMAPQQYDNGSGRHKIPPKMSKLLTGGDLVSTESPSPMTTTPFNCGWLAVPFNVTENKEVVFQYNGTCCTPKAKELLDKNEFADTFVVKNSPFMLPGYEEVTKNILVKRRQAALTSLLYCDRDACPEMEEVWTDCKSTTTSTTTPAPSSTSSVECGPLKESRTLWKVDEKSRIVIRYNGECCTAEAMKILDREKISLNIRNDELYDIIVDYLFCIEGACEIKETWSNCSGRPQQKMKQDPLVRTTKAPKIRLQPQLPQHHLPHPPFSLMLRRQMNLQIVLQQQDLFTRRGQ
ncbi:unnamed protein product [Caenorhabditis brenneri]